MVYKLACKKIDNSLTSGKFCRPIMATEKLAKPTANKLTVHGY